MTTGEGRRLSFSFFFFFPLTFRTQSMILKHKRKEEGKEGRLGFILSSSLCYEYLHVKGIPLCERTLHGCSCFLFILHLR